VNIDFIDKDFDKRLKEFNKELDNIIDYKAKVNIDFIDKDFDKRLKEFNKELDNIIDYKAFNKFLDETINIKHNKPPQI
jgi:hypothetical protein